MSYDRAAAHMNDDHADSLVLIARAFGSVPTATAARIVTLEGSGMDLEVEVEDGATRHTRVPFNPPMEEGEVRERMVQLAHQAGEGQAKNLGDHR